MKNARPLRFVPSDRNRAQAMREFRSKGFFRTRMPEAIQQAQANPARLVETILGLKPTRCEVRDIRPLGRENFGNNTRVAPLHTDSERLSPHIQILISVRPAGCGGGVSQFVDSWKVARQIRRSDPELFNELFETVRFMSFSPEPFVGYTFSLKQESLVCTHPAVPENGVGKRFQQWVDQVSPHEFFLRSGELVVASNHRLLHARTAFTDEKRHLLLLWAWFDRPIEQAPSFMVLPARRCLRKLEGLLGHDSPWIRNYLGLSSPESEIGELPPLLREPCAEIMQRIDRRWLILLLQKTGLNCPPEDLSFFFERMIRMGLQALREIPSPDEKAKRVYQLLQEMQDAAARPQSRGKRMAA